MFSADLSLPSAAKALTDIPPEQHNRLAHFLEGQGLTQLALDVTQDPEHKFELALTLKDLNVCVL